MRYLPWKFELKIAIELYLSLEMVKIQIFQLAFVVIGMHVFIQLIMCGKNIFTKNEDLCLLECKSEIENIRASNVCVFIAISDLINIKKTKFFNFRDPQTSIINGTNCLFYPPSIDDLLYNKQMYMRSGPQKWYVIFGHAHSKCFSCFVDFLSNGVNITQMGFF